MSRSLTLACCVFLGAFVLGTALFAPPRPLTPQLSAEEQYCNGPDLVTINKLKQLAPSARANVQPIIDKFDVDYQWCLHAVRLHEAAVRDPWSCEASANQWIGEGKYARTLEGEAEAMAECHAEKEEAGRAFQKRVDDSGRAADAAREAADLAQQRLDDIENGIDDCTPSHPCPWQ